MAQSGTSERGTVVAEGAPVRRLPLLLLVALSAPACSNASDVLLDRLVECELVTEGERSSRLLYGLYVPDQCYVDCLAGAECDRLEDALFCRTDLSLLVACDQRCAFRCDDGSLLAIEQECDGVAQCEDESDEEGCPEPAGDVSCGDGTRGHSCDGRWECPDGRDEQNCYPTCDGGSTIVYEWVRCDGRTYCADGADERGCSTYRCADGTEVIHRPEASPRCNGWNQCSDGSDEEGCARLSYTCD